MSYLPDIDTNKIREEFLREEFPDIDTNKISKALEDINNSGTIITIICNTINLLLHYN